MIPPVTRPNNTSNSPSSILVVIKNPVPDFARNGVTRVRVEVAAIPIKKIVFPPNLVAKNPPVMISNSFNVVFLPNLVAKNPLVMISNSFSMIS